MDKWWTSSGQVVDKAFVYLDHQRPAESYCGHHNHASCLPCDPPKDLATKLRLHSDKAVIGNAPCLADSMDQP